MVAAIHFPPLPNIQANVLKSKWRQQIVLVLAIGAIALVEILVETRFISNFSVLRQLTTSSTSSDHKPLVLVPQEEQWNESWRNDSRNESYFAQTIDNHHLTTTFYDTTTTHANHEADGPLRADTRASAKMLSQSTISQYNDSSMAIEMTPASDASSSVQSRTPVHCKYRKRENGTLGEESSASLPPVFPHMILVGAQKAGTTALHNALKLVPEFMEPRVNEPHFWDNRALPLLKEKQGTLTREELCDLANVYASYWPNVMTNMTPSTVVFEKTPVLLSLPRTAWAIRTILDMLHPNHPVKILVVLRDPVQRFFSNYKMNFQHGDTTLRVEEVIQEELKYLRKRGMLQAPRYNANIPMEEEGHEMWNASSFRPGMEVTWNYKSFLARGFYARQLVWYMRYFSLGESLMVVRYEDFQQKPAETLGRIMEFVTGKDTPVSETVRLALGTDLGPTYTHRQESYFPMSNHSEQYLKRLYKPFNDELADILGESWRDVWE